MERRILDSYVVASRVDGNVLFDLLLRVQFHPDNEFPRFVCDGRSVRRKKPSVETVIEIFPKENAVDNRPSEPVQKRMPSTFASASAVGARRRAASTTACFFTGP